MSTVPQDEPTLSITPPHESVADRAGRQTASATIALAILTFVLAAVSCWTLYEIHEGGKDTHTLAEAATDQANQTKELAIRMKEQADRTKTIADQAIVQASAALRLAAAATAQRKQRNRPFTFLNAPT